MQMALLAEFVHPVQASLFLFSQLVQLRFNLLALRELLRSEELLLNDFCLENRDVIPLIHDHLLEFIQSVAQV